MIPVGVALELRNKEKIPARVSSSWPHKDEEQDLECEDGHIRKRIMTFFWKSPSRMTGERERETSIEKRPHGPHTIVHSGNPPAILSKLTGNLGEILISLDLT